MSKLKWLPCCLLAFGLAACAVAESAANAKLPPGPMRSKAQTACTVCHDAHILVQQRLSPAAWGKEVDKMVKWGAILNPSDRDALVQYFSTNFAPDKPAYVAQRSAKSR